MLFAACQGVAPELFHQGRGWSPEDWRAAVDRLATRNLVAADGTATGAGRDLHVRIERRTDELALEPYTALGEDGTDQLLRLLEPAARRIAAAGEIGFPNPMGLPPPEPPPDSS